MVQRLRLCASTARVLSLVREVLQGQGAAKNKQTNKQNPMMLGTGHGSLPSGGLSVVSTMTVA